MPKFLLSLGGIGVLACLTWWSIFYTEVLRLTRATQTARDWEKGVAAYADCLFWDRAQCVAAKSAVKSTSILAYEPTLLWLSFGIVIAGFILALQRAGKKQGGP
jgi:hypothetical protein